MPQIRPQPKVRKSSPQETGPRSAMATGQSSDSAWPQSMQLEDSTSTQEALQSISTSLTRLSASFDSLSLTFQDFTESSITDLAVCDAVLTQTKEIAERFDDPYLEASLIVASVIRACKYVRDKIVQLYMYLTRLPNPNQHA